LKSYNNNAIIPFKKPKIILQQRPEYQTFDRRNKLLLVGLPISARHISKVSDKNFGILITLLEVELMNDFNTKLFVLYFSHGLNNRPFGLY
jgi:hypothetical protein